MFMSPVAYTVSFADLNVGSAGVSGFVGWFVVVFLFVLLLLLFVVFFGHAYNIL